VLEVILPHSHMPDALQAAARAASPQTPNRPVAARGPGSRLQPTSTPFCPLQVCRSAGRQVQDALIPPVDSTRLPGVPNQMFALSAAASKRQPATREQKRIRHAAYRFQPCVPACCRHWGQQKPALRRRRLLPSRPSSAPRSKNCGCVTTAEGTTPPSSLTSASSKRQKW
jgi:hypothetical protein